MFRPPDRQARRTSKLIPVNALFSPSTRPAYKVAGVRVGQFRHWHAR
jgi:DNA-directed RNA polymerase alpha subunit